MEISAVKGCYNKFNAYTMPCLFLSQTLPVKVQRLVLRISLMLSRMPDLSERIPAVMK